MNFRNPLIEANFIKRYKRFFADVEIQKEVVVAHVANTGSMKGCLFPGKPCLVSPAENPERKLRYSLEAVLAPSGVWVGVNTSRPNQLVAEAFEKKVFEHWKEFDSIRAEVKLSKETRIDFLLENSKTGKKRYVEVKNVTLAAGDIEAKQGIAQFPDAVTERGQKHLKELIELNKAGAEAEIFFCVQRNDCVSFQTAEFIDPEYSRLLIEAKKSGVIVTSAVCEIDEKGIHLTGKTLPVLD